MIDLTFYEKPGCLNNTKQKALLASAGYRVAAFNLLEHAWTEQSLRPFFGTRPVAQWFNPSAPRIKSGEVVPEDMDEAGALRAMLTDPLLIRRPLIRFGDRCEVGFDAEIEYWLGVSSRADDLETCPEASEASACELPSASKSD